MYKMIGFFILIWKLFLDKTFLCMAIMKGIGWMHGAMILLLLEAVTREERLQILQYLENSPHQLLLLNVVDMMIKTMVGSKSWPKDEKGAGNAGTGADIMTIVEKGIVTVDMVMIDT